MQLFTQTQKLAIKSICIIIVALLFVLLLFATVPPLLSTRWQILPQPPTAWLGVINNFGGFFGGIIGPAAAVSGFYFLYITYKSQLDTQRITLLDKLYNDLLEDIKSLYYREQVLDKSGHLRNKRIHEGIDALYNYRPVQNGNSVLNHLNLIINSFSHLIIQIKKYLDDDPDGIYENLLNKTYLMYHAKILWPVLEGLYKFKIEIFIKDWGSPEILFFNFEKLTKETFDYLSNKRLIKTYTVKEHNNIIVHYLENILNTEYTPDSHNKWLSEIDLLKSKFSIAYPSNREKIGIIIKWLLPTNIAQALRIAFRPAPKSEFTPPFPLVERSNNWWLRQSDRHEEAIKRRHS